MTDTTDIASLKKQIETAADIIRDLTDKLEAERQRVADLVREKENATYEWGEAQSNYDSAKSKIRSLEAELAALKGDQVPVVLPEDLHPQTAKLVINFASALAEKLHKAEQKYGYSDTWMQPHWQIKCLDDFKHHVSKGDPRDVAAYCAFMWYHGWSTAVKGE